MLRVDAGQGEAHQPRGMRVTRGIACEVGGILVARHPRRLLELLVGTHTMEERLRTGPCLLLREMQAREEAEQFWMRLGSELDTHLGREAFHEIAGTDAGVVHCKPSALAVLHGTTPLILYPIVVKERVGQGRWLGEHVLQMRCLLTGKEGGELFFRHIALGQGCSGTHNEGRSQKESLCHIVCFMYPVCASIYTSSNRTYSFRMA